MRVVIQRVTEASVTVDKKVIGKIGKGLLVLAGVEKGDTEQDIDYMVAKVTGLRIFEDNDGKMRCWRCRSSPCWGTCGKDAVRRLPARRSRAGRRICFTCLSTS